MAAGRPLKVGVQLPEVEREVRWPELLDMVRAIEDLGYDSIWLGEHLLYRWEDRPPRGPWEAWTSMAGIAAVTSRVEFGPFVACTNFHNPALLAKQAATIDEISGGRFILGLGAGWNETEFRAFGFPYDHRVDRFEEAFTIIRTLLHDGAIDFDGRFYQARDCELLPRGPRPGGPPLLIGSNGPRMLRMTMPHADAWNSWFADIGNRPEGVARLRDVVDDACRDVGRDPADIARTVAVLVAAARRVRSHPGRLRRRRASRRSMARQTRMAETLRAYARAGIGTVQLVLDPITLDRSAPSRRCCRSSIAADRADPDRENSVRGGSARTRVLASGPRCEISNRSRPRATAAPLALPVIACRRWPRRAAVARRPRRRRRRPRVRTASPSPPPIHLIEPAAVDAIFRALDKAGLKLMANNAGAGSRGRAHQAHQCDIRRTGRSS